MKRVVLIIIIIVVFITGCSNLKYGKNAVSTSSWIIQSTATERNYLGKTTTQGSCQLHYTYGADTYALNISINKYTNLSEVDELKAYISNKLNTLNRDAYKNSTGFDAFTDDVIRFCKSKGWNAVKRNDGSDRSIDIY